ncbi:hypothetical protein DFH09DRAFT_1228912 [Mycena vulgaris]|nr:hypothetical protein DFH09DRAFT_1228912 [Mycena vulgaris]
MALQPPLTQLSKIVDVADACTIPSRIPEVVDRTWKALLSDTHLGRTLRRPFWLAFNDYDDIPFYPDGHGDAVLLEYISHLRAPFRLYLQASDDPLDIGFTPIDPTHEVEPTICFTPAHNAAVEAVRTKVVNSGSQDDLDELRQLDFLTIVVFIHELAHVIWRAKWPQSAHKPPVKYKASPGSLEEVLWGRVMNVQVLNLAGVKEAKGLFYSTWDHGRNLVPDYSASDDEDDEYSSESDEINQRHLCSITNPDAPNGSETLYLTRAGAARICNNILGFGAVPVHSNIDHLRVSNTFASIALPDTVTGTSKRSSDALRSHRAPQALHLTRAVGKVNKALEKRLNRPFLRQNNCGPSKRPLRMGVSEL